MQKILLMLHWERNPNKLSKYLLWVWVTTAVTSSTLTKIHLYSPNTLILVRWHTSQENDKIVCHGTKSTQDLILNSGPATY